MFEWIGTLVLALALTGAINVLTNVGTRYVDSKLKYRETKYSADQPIVLPLKEDGPSRKITQTS
jgi:hypothetical protein